MSDPVRPDHYKLNNGLEVIDVIGNIMSVEDFCIGNVIKYVLRYKGKNGKEDLCKARWYLNRAIDELEERGE